MGPVSLAMTLSTYSHDICARLKRARVVHSRVMSAPKLCNPWNPKNKIIPVKEIVRILREYGVTTRIPDLSLFKQACVHTSYVDKSDVWAKQEEPMVLAERPETCLPLQAADNEELEYAGDGLLSGVVGTYLKERFSG